MSKKTKKRDLLLSKPVVKKALAAIAVFFSIFLFNTFQFSNLPTLATETIPSDMVTPLLTDNPSSQWLAQKPTADDLSTSPIIKQRETNKLEKWSDFRGKLGAINIFIIFFVTLGPLKIIPTFVKITQNADEDLRKNLAIRGAGLSTVIILLVVMIGGNILTKWTVSLEALLLAAGILLFLASLQLLMSQYESSNSSDPPPEPSMKLLINPLIFPSILTPYGIAIALILMISNSRVSDRPLIVPILLVVVMVLNLLAMLAARPILRTLKPATLQILGLVLGVMQLALGLEIILSGIQLSALTLQDLLQ